MALLRITQMDQHALTDRYMIVVDVFYPDDETKEDHTYLVIAPAHEITTSDKLRAYVEQDIILQRTATPNWIGEVWKSATL